LSALENQTNAPEFLAVEFGLNIVLHLSMQVDSLGCINYFRESAAYGLHAEFDREIAGQGPAGWWVKYHKECSRSYIRMSPERNFVRANHLVFKKRKGRAIVRTSWQRMHQAEE
jgi:hypothetical protein